MERTALDVVQLQLDLPAVLTATPARQWCSGCSGGFGFGAAT